MDFLGFAIRGIELPTSRQQDQHRFLIRKHQYPALETSVSIPAATVVVMRDGNAGLEVLMLQKSSKVAFGGTWVFPGGRIDEKDKVFDKKGNIDQLSTAAEAAARESYEEASISINPTNMVWLSYWVPPSNAPKRFSTFFFATKLTNGSTKVVVDDEEITKHQWLEPADAIRRHDNAEIALVVPTWMTLNQMTCWNEADQALKALRQKAPDFYETRMCDSADGPVAMWEGDAGYQDCDPDIPGKRHRLTMSPDGYNLELNNS